jgi:hypothetical protein
MQQQPAKEVNHMFLHPHVSSQISSYQRREQLALAGQRGRAQQAAAVARAARRAGRARWPMRQAARRALQLRAQPGQ